MRGVNSSMACPPVSIVIPNYNGELLLPRSLTKVYEAVQDYPGIAEVIVVDDGSKDRSVLLVQQGFPDTRIILHPVNQGFSEAVMTGVMNSSHEIVILLNSDVYPYRDFIEPLMRRFDRPDTFSVSPLVCNLQGTPTKISWNLPKIVRGNIRREKWKTEALSRAQRDGQPLLSLFASGGSMAFRKSMFLELRGFLPLYKPFYREDRDLGTRAWKRGWKTYCEPLSRVIHDHSGTSTIRRHFSALKVHFISSRNKFIYLWLHLSPRTLVFSHLPWLIPRLLGRLAILDVPFVMGFFAAITSVREIYQLRSSWKRDGHAVYLDDLSETIKQGRERTHACQGDHV